MQAAQGHVLLGIVPLCKLQFTADSAPTSAQDVIDPLKFTRVMLFSTISERNDLTCTCSGHHLQLVLVVIMSQLAQLCSSL